MVQLECWIKPVRFVISRSYLQDLKRACIETVAGTAGGVIGIIVGYPLDTVKVSALYDPRFSSDRADPSSDTFYGIQRHFRLHQESRAQAWCMLHVLSASVHS